MYLPCVEIKIYVPDNTISDTEEALRKHGRIIIFQYRDIFYKDCAPSQNSGQVVHQACIVRPTVGAFVTAKENKGEGGIVQIVIINFIKTDLE